MEVTNSELDIAKSEGDSTFTLNPALTPPPEVLESPAVSEKFSVNSPLALVPDADTSGRSRDDVEIEGQHEQLTIAALPGTEIVPSIAITMDSTTIPIKTTTMISQDDGSTDCRSIEDSHTPRPESTTDAQTAKSPEATTPHATIVRSFSRLSELANVASAMDFIEGCTR